MEPFDVPCSSNLASDITQTPPKSASEASLSSQHGASVDVGKAWDVDGESGWDSFKAEAKLVFQLAVPTSITNLFAHMLWMVPIAFVGRLGEFELSVAVLAFSVLCTTGITPVMGFTAAMETFCGQAYGAGAYHTVGVVLQRALLLNLLLATALAGLWSQAEGLLVAMGQDAAISRGVARYLHLILPALFSNALFEAFKRYLLAQGVVHPPTAITMTCFALSFPINWLFVFKLGWGIDGSVVAVDVVQMMMAMGMGIFIAMRDFCRKESYDCTWGGWSMMALHGWGSYIQIALPSLAMTVAEYWQVEAVILMSGLLPNPSLTAGVTGILFYVQAMVYLFVWGLSMATTARVATSLGAGRPEAAREAVLAAMVILLCTESAAVTVIVLGRAIVPRIFTNVQEVVDLSARLIPIFALGFPFDGFSNIMQGVLRGSGEQRIGAVTYICSYWGFGIPLSTVLAFKMDCGVWGFAYGQVATFLVQALVMFLVALRFDFRKQAVRAVARCQQHASLVDPLLDEASYQESHA